MSTEAVVQFRKAVNASDALQREMREMEKVTPETLSTFAAKHGYECTPEELIAVGRDVGNELTDFELEMVAGGVDDTETMFTGRVTLQAAVSIPPLPKEDNPNAELC